MLGGALVPFRNFFCSFPLDLEMDGLGIPFLDGGWYGIHGHDSSHEGGEYSSGEVSNKDIWVFYIGPGDMVLEFQDVLVQGRRVL